MDIDKEIDDVISSTDIVSQTRLYCQWQYRRRIILSTLLFCAGCVVYIMLNGADTRINENIVLGCFSLAGSVIGFYVAGATWNDVNVKKINMIENIKKPSMDENEK